MKKILILILIFFLYQSFIFSQENFNKRFTNNSLFLLNSFKKGTVFFKSGSKSEGKFNYNVVYDKICFIKNNQIYNISNHTEIDSVIFDDLTFYCFNEKNYELIASGKIDILLYRKANLSSEESEGAYGTSSNTASVSKKTSLYTGKGVYGGENINLQNQSDSEISIINKYYFQFNDKLNPANKYQIYKYYKKNKSEIKQFIKKNNIDFQNISDLKSLVEFLEHID